MKSAQIRPWIFTILRDEIGTLLFAGVALLRGMLFPMWVSVPRVGAVSAWTVHFLLARILPLVLFFVLWPVWRRFRNSGRLGQMGLVRGVIILISIYLFSVVTFATQLYGIWGNNAVGKFLLPPYSGYYLRIVGEFASPYSQYLLAGLLTGGVFGLFYLLTWGRAVEKNEVLLGVLLGTMHGPNVIYVVGGAFGLAFVSSTIKAIGRQEFEFMRITPFLFVSSYIMLLLQEWLL